MRPTPSTPAQLEPAAADSKHHTRAVVTALFVTLLWSSSWILIRYGLDDEELAPLTFAGLRYTLAALILIAWAASNQRHRSAARDVITAKWRALVVLGLVYYSVTQGAQFIAIDAQPAATSSLMLAPTALIVALVSSRSLGERPSRQQFAGAALIIIGAIWYFSGDLGATVLGMIASVVGLFANAAGSLLGRSANRAALVAPVLVTTISMSVGAPVLLVAGLLIEGWPELTFKLGLLIAWLAVVNTAVAFTLWNRSMQHLAAFESAAINNTMLIQIAALAWIFLDEPPGAIAVVGIVCVSLGAFLTTSPQRARSR